MCVRGRGRYLHSTHHFGHGIIIPPTDEDMRFRGLDLPKATALHVKATATRPCSLPRSPSESFMRSPAPQQPFLCRLGEAGPPDALPRAPEQ